MLFSLVSAALEQLLNQLIKLDNLFIDELSGAVRKQLSVEIHDIKLALTIIFDGRQFIVLPAADKQNDCYISGDLNTLLELKKPENVTQLIRSGKLTLEGDLHLAQSYSKAFSQLNIDWADNLSAYFGDGPAYTLVAFIKNCTEKSKQQLSVSQLTFTSLLQDELKVSIHPLEAQLFKQQCRALQQELSQLEQRVNKLASTL